MSLTRRVGTGGSDPRVRTARPFRVLAYDPGGTTGWVYAEWQSLPPLKDLNQIKFSSGQIGPHEHHQELHDHLDEYSFGINGPPIELVCESFEFRQHINKDQAKTKVELISKEYIGVIKLFSQIHDIPVTFNTASAAKQFVPDKGPQANVKLRQLGLYTPGMAHANDAYRHLLRYLVVNKRIREPITNHWM